MKNLSVKIAILILASILLQFNVLAQTDVKRIQVTPKQSNLKPTGENNTLSKKEKRKRKKQLRKQRKRKKASVPAPAVKQPAKVRPSSTINKDIPQHINPITMGSTIVNYANRYQGIPYKWGGNTATAGFDCSGFTVHVFKKHNINLPRTSSEQAKTGKSVPLRKADVGDLVFFGDSTKNIDHVGIVASKNGKKISMIHASSSQGVVVTDIYSSNYWRKRLRKARRVL